MHGLQKPLNLSGISAEAMSELMKTLNTEHTLLARICVEKNMNVIPRSIELLKEDWSFDLTVLEDLHMVISLAGKATLLEKGKSKEEVGTSNLVSYEEIQGDNFNSKKSNFNSKEDNFISKRDSLDRLVDKRAQVKESNNLTRSGPVPNQIQVGLEADQIYYKTGPNGKKGKTKVLNEAKLFILKAIWQVKKPNPTSNRSSALLAPSDPSDLDNHMQTESVEQISGKGQSDADDERIPLERIHRPLQQHTSSKELAAFSSSDTDFPSIAIREALPSTWYEGNPNPQVIDKPTVVETSKWTKITMVKA